MRRWIESLSLGLVAIVIVAFTGAAQQAQLASNALSARIDRIFAPFDRPGSPGCAVGVSRNGQPVYTHGYGEANLEFDVPISAASIFESGSVAKQFTAALVLLAQDGKLSLDDDIRSAFTTAGSVMCASGGNPNVLFIGRRRRSVDQARAID